MKEIIEEVLRNRVLFIGNEMPNVFLTDNRDKCMFLGSPQSIVDEIVEKLNTLPVNQ